MQNHKKQEISPRIVPWLTKIIYPLGAYVVIPFYFGKIEITGQENIPKSGGVIIAPTHRSRWDALIVPYATGKFVSKRDIYFMVTVDEMKGFQGWLISRLGGFAVNPHRPSRDTLRYSIKLLSQGEMMVMFPEGGIIRKHQVAPLKPGVARIALDVQSSTPTAHIKILPVNVQYSQEIPKRGCDIKVNIGSCLNVAEYDHKNIKQDTLNLTKDLEDKLKILDISKN